MLIDSNIVIYAAQPEHVDLRRFIAESVPTVSAISYVEVLGYHKLADNERDLLKAFFAAATILPLSNAILDQAVQLRQQKKMTLGDALIGATAIVHQVDAVLMQGLEAPISALVFGTRCRAPRRVCSL